jgi:DNA polymerase-1
VPDVRVFGISAAIELNGIINLFWGRLGSPLFLDLVKLLQTPGPKVFHNARYDVRACSVSGFEIAPQIECSYIMSRIVWDRRQKHSLQALSEFLCPELSDWKTTVGKYFNKDEGPTPLLKKMFPDVEPEQLNYSFIPDAEMAKYSMTDTFIGLMLAQRLMPEIQTNFQDIYDREKKVYPIINKIEDRGMRFDAAKARKQARLLDMRMATSMKQMIWIADEHNPNSPKQVLAVLLANGIKRSQLTVKGKLTTDQLTLTSVAKAIASTSPHSLPMIYLYIIALLVYKTCAKINNTYLKPLADRADRTGGIIHCHINPADARTGRMTCSDPNLQNQPRGDSVRSCFICRDGYTNYYFDYSQMEMVIFGVFAQEPRILTAYEEGEDLHTYTASQVYKVSLSEVTKEQRQQCKSVNFGIIYGIGIIALAKDIGQTVNNAKALLEQYNRTFPSIRRFQWECKQELERYGYVQDWFGRRYHIPYGQAYKAVNALVQGTCASIFKQALINVAEELDNERESIILPVHDEIQIEVLQKGILEYVFTKTIIRKMTEIAQVTDRGLRLRVDVAKSVSNWAEKVKIKI